MLRLQKNFSLLLTTSTLFLALAVNAQPQTPVDIQADQYEFHPEKGIATGDGDVRVVYEDMVLKADHVEYNNRTQEIAAKGNVVFTRDSLTWRGDKISGNLETKEFDFGTYRANLGVWYAKGEDADYLANETVVLDKTQLSTCEYYDNPHYSLNAKRVIYYPSGRFRATNVMLKLGDVPVFYLPVIFGNTKASAGNIEIKPGYDSEWGPYLLLGQEYALSDTIRTKFMLHLRANNGVALGNRTRIKTDRTETEFLAYGMRDNDPPETTDGFNRRFEVEEDRYRFYLQHRNYLTENTTMRLQLDALSDIDMLEDWFENEYEDLPQTRNYVDITHNADNFSLSLRIRPRVNDFYTVVEALPELQFVVPRQPIGNSAVYYESRNSISNLKMKWREFDRERPQGDDLEDYQSWRADTLHMFYLPVSLKDGWQLTPRAGVRLTYYENSSSNALSRQDLDNLFEVDDPDNPFSTLAIQNYDDDGGDKWRWTGELGLKLSAKFYKTWSDFNNERCNVAGLRHVVQPYVNYTYIPEPSEDREYLYFFDDVDRLLEQNFIRFGVEQRLQTRRSDRIYTLARMNSYADFHFYKEEDFHHLGNFGTELQVNPNENTAFWTTIVADMGEPALNRGEVGFRYGRPESWRTSFSYLYRDDYHARTVYSMGGNLADFSGENTLLARNFAKSHYAVGDLAFPINSKTSGHIRYEYDLVEDELALQSYELIRDLHCWMGALRVQEENDDLQLLIVLWLKAFPSVRLDTGF